MDQLAHGSAGDRSTASTALELWPLFNSVEAEAVVNALRRHAYIEENLQTGKETHMHVEVTCAWAPTISACINV
eukprot:350706-Chlamydomonas_euryale.AAC.3